MAKDQAPSASMKIHDHEGKCSSELLSDQDFLKDFDQTLSSQDREVNISSVAISLPKVKEHNLVEAFKVPKFKPAELYLELSLKKKLMTFNVKVCVKMVCLQHKITNGTESSVRLVTLAETQKLRRGVKGEKGKKSMHLACVLHTSIIGFCRKGLLLSL